MKCILEMSYADYDYETTVMKTKEIFRTIMEILPMCDIS